MAQNPPAEAATELPSLLRAGDGVGPDFICVGAPRAGTSWLFDQLSGHPDFWMPPVKELHYFDSRFRPRRIAPLLRLARSDLARLNSRPRTAESRPIQEADIPFFEAALWLHDQPFDLDHYARMFNPKGGSLSGDITPAYAILPDDRAGEVLRRFPEAKIIYIVREPITRFWSNYCTTVARARKRPDWYPTWPLGEEDDPAALASVERFIDWAPAAVRHSDVAMNAARWRDRGGHRLGVFYFDDMVADPVLALGRILAFLGVDPDRPRGTLPASFNRKSAAPKLDMSPDVRARLIELFAPALRAAAAELGGPAIEWPMRYGL